MRIPYASNITACFSGITLALLLSTGEYVGGYLQAVLTGLGVIWFPVSIAVFVHGKQTMEMQMESLMGKRPRTDVPKDLTPRALIWFCSTLVTAWALSLWLKK